MFSNGQRELKLEFDQTLGELRQAVESSLVKLSTNDLVSRATDPSLAVGHDAILRRRDLVDLSIYPFQERLVALSRSYDPKADRRVIDAQTKTNVEREVQYGIKNALVERVVEQAQSDSGVTDKTLGSLRSYAPHEPKVLTMVIDDLQAAHATIYSKNGNTNQAIHLAEAFGHVGGLEGQCLYQGENNNAVVLKAHQLKIAKLGAGHLDLLAQPSTKAVQDQLDSLSALALHAMGVSLAFESNGQPQPVAINKPNLNTPHSNNLDRVGRALVAGALFAGVPALSVEAAAAATSSPNKQMIKADGNPSISAVLGTVKVLGNASKKSAGDQILADGDPGVPAAISVDSVVGTIAPPSTHDGVKKIIMPQGDISGASESALPPVRKGPTSTAIANASMGNKAVESAVADAIETGNTDTAAAILASAHPAEVIPHLDLVDQISRTVDGQLNTSQTVSPAIQQSVRQIMTLAKAGAESPNVLNSLTPETLDVMKGQKTDAGVSAKIAARTQDLSGQIQIQNLFAEHFTPTQIDDLAALLAGMEQYSETGFASTHSDIDVLASAVAPDVKQPQHDTPPVHNTPPGDNTGANNTKIASSADIPPSIRRIIERAIVGSQHFTAAEIAGQLWVESGFQTNAISGAGAQGIAQFMPGTFDSVGIDGNHDGFKNALDPEDAIPTQIKYDEETLNNISQFFDQHAIKGVDVKAATYMSYNWGINNVEAFAKQFGRLPNESDIGMAFTFTYGNISTTHLVPAEAVTYPGKIFGAAKRFDPNSHPDATQKQPHESVANPVQAAMQDMLQNYPTPDHFPAGPEKVVAVAIAEARKGIVESPLRCDAGNTMAPGSCGPEIDKYTQGISGQPLKYYWCMAAAGYIKRVGGQPVTVQDADGRTPSTFTARNNFINGNDGNFEQDKNNGQIGDLIFWSEHVGVVVGKVGDFYLTVQGNTTKAGFGNNGVQLGLKAVSIYSDFLGFGHSTQNKKPDGNAQPDRQSYQAPKPDSPEPDHPKGKQDDPFVAPTPGGTPTIINPTEAPTDTPNANNNPGADNSGANGNVAAPDNPNNGPTSTSNNPSDTNSAAANDGNGNGNGDKQPTDQQQPTAASN